MPTDIPIVGPLVNRIFGTRNERFVRRYNQRVDQINALEGRVRALTDGQLRAKTEEFRAAVRGGKAVDDLLPEAF
ncbi:MAG TPA: hypothetical protein DEB06_04720, partial [Phycisphaerales bacterium]|nr:hypothetical protein [Phycisphaerales bacterium]